MDRGEQKALADIDRYGCHVIHVLEEDELPSFTYSVGIQRSSGRPEGVIVGLKQPLAHSVINEYNRRAQEGEVFTPGEQYSGFIEGFDLVVERVDPEFYHEYFGWNLWLYGGPEFDVIQLVWPSTDGVWPWQIDAPASFRDWQPLLTKSPISPIRYP